MKPYDPIRRVREVPFKYIQWNGLGNEIILPGLYQEVGRLAKLGTMTYKSNRQDQFGFSEEVQMLSVKTNAFFLGSLQCCQRFGCVDQLQGRNSFSVKIWGCFKLQAPPIACLRLCNSAAARQYEVSCITNSFPTVFHRWLDTLRPLTYEQASMAYNLNCGVSFVRKFIPSASLSVYKHHRCLMSIAFCLELIYNTKISCSSLSNGIIMLPTL